MPQAQWRPRGRLLALTALLIAVVAAPSLALAAARKLNGDLAIGGRIAPAEQFDFILGRTMYPGYQVSPDPANSRVVYLADQSTAGVFELYSVPAGGGSPIKLNAPLAAGGNVVEFAIDGAGQRVVYLADQQQDETFELFSVPIDGSAAPVPLNSFLVADGDVTNFVITPNGSRVIFRADMNDDNVFDLFGVPIGGGVNVRLNNRTGPVGDVQPDFAVTPNNQRVIFRWDSNLINRYGIFSAAPDLANQSTFIGGSSGAGSSTSVLDFVISPSLAQPRVAFRVQDPGTLNSNLFLTPLDPGTFFALTTYASPSSVELPGVADLPLEDRIFPEDRPYAFTPDAADIIYIADEIDARYELFRVAVPTGPTATPPVKLVTIFDPVEDVTNFRISPDSNRIIYRADDADNRFELWSVARSGGAVSFLIPNPPPVGGDIYEFAISADSSRVVYRGDFITDERFELRSSPIDRSAGTVVLNGTLAPEGDVVDFAITPNSQQVVFSADQDVDGVVEIYTVLINGGAATRLNPTLVSRGNVEDFVLSPNGAQVVFRADVATDEVFSLTGVPATGPSTASIALTNASSVSGDVLAMSVAPDATFAVYWGDEQTDEVRELFRADLGSTGRIRLNGELGPNGDVVAYQISPTSQHVVYLADQETDEVFELYSVPADGGAPVKLNGNLAAGGTIQQFVISPDGARVVYGGDEDGDGVFDLYSVPIDGGSRTPLSTLLPGQSFAKFAISPNSQRVLYIADENQDDLFELWSIAIGGGSPARLNATLPVGGDVEEFVISPDSTRVVYAADQNTNDVTELYSTPLNASSPVRLLPQISPNADVTANLNCFGQRGQWDALDPFGVAPFLISPDSARVVFCADLSSDDVQELYSSPIATGNAAIKLNIPPGLGGFVNGFEISADSNRVAFNVLTQVAGVFQGQLYVAPIGGGSQPTLLNGPVPASSFVQRFAFSADSATVAFTSDRQLAGQIELYATPVTGGAPSKRSGTLVTGGNVDRFVFTPDSELIVYTADQLSNDVDELFVTTPAGVAAPFVVSDPLVTNGDVLGDFILTSTGTSVVYRADQSIDEVFELFETSFQSTTPGDPRLAFSNDLLVSEGGGTAELTVTLSESVSAPVTVNYSVTGGTASGGGVDFILPAGTLTFNPGETTRTIPITVVDDSVAELDETVIVTLASPGNALLGTKITATITIRDNDGDTVYLPLVRR